MRHRTVRLHHRACKVSHVGYPLSALVSSLHFSRQLVFRLTQSLPYNTVLPVYSYKFWAPFLVLYSTCVTYTHLESPCRFTKI
ncbi:hypothetical protein C0J52_13359 [Blattella germanica]|nr:hypothetical protein C0J52_13359 [Blattella germanica]